MQRQRARRTDSPTTTARATSGNRAPESKAPPPLASSSSPASVDVGSSSRVAPYHHALSVRIPTCSKSHAQGKTPARTQPNEVAAARALFSESDWMRIRDALRVLACALNAHK
jgi:hypothetical protein